MSDILKMIAESELFNPIKTTTLYSEAATDKGMVPIYVILTSGDSLMSKIIMKFTGSKYSHATVAMNYYETVSMGTTNKNYGVAVESIFEFPDRWRNKDMKITRRFIPIDIYEKMVYNIEQFKQNYKRIDYSFGKLSRFISWLPHKRITQYKNQTSFICSEFVALILSNLTDFNNKLKRNIGRGSRFIISPREVETKIMDTFETIYEGPIFGMPMDLLYKADRQYIKVKKNIVEKCKAKLKEGLENLKGGKQYAESELPSIWNSPAVLSAKMKALKDAERKFIEDTYNISIF